MRLLTALAPPGAVLSRAIIGPDGMPLAGRGTRLTPRYLRLLHEEGVRLVECEDDPAIEPWRRVPEVDAYLRALDARFEPVRGDRRMMALHDAVRRVYLDFLDELEG